MSKTASKKPKPSPSATAARTSSANRAHPRKTGTLTVLIVLVVLAVIVTHWPSLSAKARCFDDNQYLIDNPLVQNPSWASAKQFLAEVLEPSTVRGYYQPLAMISLMLDHASGGARDNFRPFHRTSLALHAANTALVMVLLYLLFNEPYVAAMVGLLFGLHPMTVEPIPWIGERKTLLASFFSLGCLILYVRYTNTRSWKCYVACLATYVLALMSKPTSTALPILFLLMDYWPLRRLSLRSLWEKIPLFMILGVSAIITIISQGRTARIMVSHDPFYAPILLCHDIVFYLCKIIYPTNLSPHYPFPEPMNLTHPMVLMSVIGTCILIPLLLVSLRWTRALLIGWLFFFVAIFPSLGILKFSNIVAADKFAYLPSVGLLMIVAWLLSRFWDTPTRAIRLTKRAWSILGLVAILMLAEARTTRQQLTHWQDSVTLFDHMLKFAPDAPPVHFSLASMLAARDQNDRAIKHYRKVLEQSPNYPDTHYGLANLFYKKGQFDEAIEHYTQDLRLKPDRAAGWANLGLALNQKGRLDEAVKAYRSALAIQPDNSEWYCMMGQLSIQQGQLEQATHAYQRVTELEQDNLEALVNLGALLGQQNKLRDATTYFERALAIEPNHYKARNGLGVNLAQQGNIEEAIQQFNKALTTNPEGHEAYKNLALALVGKGDLDDAVAAYRKVLTIQPRDADSYARLGDLFAMQARTDDANQAYRQALQIDPNNARARNGLNASRAKRSP